MVLGDKIRLVKPFGTLTNIGEICMVTGFSATGEIYFQPKDYRAGIMSYADFEKYFELVSTENKVEKKKHEWTEWQPEDDDFYNPITDEFERIGLEWRTDNEKRVQIRVMESEPQIKSRSSCYKDDRFSVYDGFTLAKYRLYVKWVTKLIDDYTKTL